MTTPTIPPVRDTRPRPPKVRYVLLHTQGTVVHRHVWDRCDMGAQSIEPIPPSTLSTREALHFQEMVKKGEKMRRLDEKRVLRVEK